MDILELVKELAKVIPVISATVVVVEKGYTCAKSFLKKTFYANADYYSDPYPNNYSDALPA